MYSIQLALLKLVRFIAAARLENSRLKAAAASTRGVELVEAWDRSKQLLIIDDLMMRVGKIETGETIKG